MPKVVNVRFKTAGPVYHFAPAGVEFEVGDWVIVDTARGKSMGQVLTAPEEIPEDEVQEPLKSVVRKATSEDIQSASDFATKEPETLDKCAELIAKHDLPMKPVAAEYNFDGSHLTVYFSAEKKVDFRALLKELGATFKARVELRQIGARDVAKLLGGLGRCGRSLCCTTHLSKFDPISVRMARDQDLPLNPAMISGQCGKLLCCLKYEHEQYVDIKKGLPAVGKMASTPRGQAKVLKINTLKGTATVSLENETAMEFKISEVRPAEKKGK